jgi:hypothetical protein
MSRLPAHIQTEAIKSRKRYNTLVALLDSFDWKASGYKDKFAWLSDLYGPGHIADQLFKLQAQFEAENLL